MQFLSHKFLDFVFPEIKICINLKNSNVFIFKFQESTVDTDHLYCGRWLLKMRKTDRNLKFGKENEIFIKRKHVYVCWLLLVLE